MVHMLIGIQGSGKTTFAKQLQKELNCEIASTDYIRANYKDVKEADVFSMVYKMCSDALNNNKDIIGSVNLLLLFISPPILIQLVPLQYILQL